MRRWVPWVCLLLLVVGVLVPTTAVLAAYNYYYPIRVYNNSTTAYSNGTAVLVTLNNSQLSSLGFIGADGLDTDVQEGAAGREFMVQSTRLGVFFPTLMDGQARVINYRLGNTPEQTAFPVITGVGGNVTIDDDAGLELGSNFTIELGGWVDTDSGTDKNLVYKHGAFELAVSDTVGGNLTASILELLPNGNDASGVWASIDNAHDGDTSTRASCAVSGAGGSNVLYLTNTPSATASSLKYWVTGASITNLQIQIYYDAAYHEIYSANPTLGEFVTVNFAEQTFSKIYVQFTVPDATTVYVNEIQSGDTPTISVSATGVESGEHTIIAAIEER